MAKVGKHTYLVSDISHGVKKISGFELPLQRKGNMPDAA